MNEKRYYRFWIRDNQSLCYNCIDSLMACYYTKEESKLYNDLTEGCFSMVAIEESVISEELYTKLANPKHIEKFEISFINILKNKTNNPRNIDKISSDIKKVLKELLSIEFDIKDTKGFNSDYYVDTLQKIKDISLELRDLQSIFMEDRVNDIQMNELI